MKKGTNNPKVLYPELSYSIIGAAMDVHNELGPGWDEWDYHKAMIQALEKQGHSVGSHDRKNLIHRDVSVDLFELDILVDNLIILELKHLKEDFNPVHFTQLINYLKCWDVNLGLLINFGLNQLRYKRVPFSETNASLEYIGYWDELPRSDREIVAQAVKELLTVVGSGYGADVFKKLLKTELDFMAVSFEKLSIIPTYGDMRFGERDVDAISFGAKSVVSVSASSSATDLSYLKTYMKQSGRPYGILVNLDKSKVQVRGVL
ncbi:GxxExxY protein [Pontiellaceae bacterium B1224]|nr:GxxExxY protein [Pontiellaceae bacterium B1224]